MLFAYKNFSFLLKGAKLCVMRSDMIYIPLGYKINDDSIKTFYSNLYT
jgi:hypothetical protein